MFETETESKRGGRETEETQREKKNVSELDLQTIKKKDIRGSLTTRGRHCSRTHTDPERYQD